MRSSRPSQLQSSKQSYPVERGGRSLGIARHWQPVLRMYISPFTTSRTFTVRLLPPRLPGRMSGSTWLHSSSVKSLGYRSLLRSYRARFSIVHIGDLSTTQAAILASQALDFDSICSRTGSKCVLQKRHASGSLKAEVNRYERRGGGRLSPFRSHGSV